MKKATDPAPYTLDEIKSKFSHYIIEIRRRIFFTTAVFFVATVLGLIFNEQIIKYLVSILSLEGVNIVFTSPFQFINLAVSCGIVTGIVVVFPVIIFQLMHFLKPALKLKEYSFIKKFLPYSILLFITGFVFGAIIMKWQIEIFLERSISLGIGNILDISGLLSVVFLTSAFLGLGFQFPIVLLILLRLGVVSSKQISKKRLWIYLFSFLFTLFLPADSIIADVILSLPLIFLFESTLVINRLLDSKKYFSTKR